MTPRGRLALAMSLCLASATVTAAQPTLLASVTVVNVEAGGLAEGTSLLIRDGVIAGLGDGVDVDQLGGESLSRLLHKTWELR